MTSLNNPFFSIIMPVYNGAATIDKTIRSIVEQDFKDWELLILDSCSTDDTGEILAGYVSDTRIKHLVEKDKGIYDGMNKGLEQARGKWIYFTGCDDYFISNDTLNKIYDTIRDHSDRTVIYGKVQFQNSGREYDRDFDLYRLSYKNICHQAIFYSRSIFEKYGNYSSEFPLLADWEFNIRWMDEAPSLYIDEVIASYNELGASGIQNDARFRERLPHLIKKALRTRSFKSRLRFYKQKLLSR